MADKKKLEKEEIRPLDTKVNFGKEIEELPIQNIIGGCFEGVLNAQWQAARVTIDFVEHFGFERNDKKGKDTKDKKSSTSRKSGSMGKPKMVEFKYQKAESMIGIKSPPYVVRIPMLTMLPIPYLRIESLTIGFSVKLTQVKDSQRNLSSSQLNISNDSDEVTTTSETKDNAGKEGKTRDSSWREKYDENDTWTSTAAMTGIVNTTSYNNQGMRVSREYSLKIDIEAVESPIPTGMERMLDILTSLIGTADKQVNPLDQFVTQNIGKNIPAGNTGGATGAPTGGAGQTAVGAV